MRVSRRILFPLLVFSIVSFLTSLADSRASGETSGEALFKQNCSGCHPAGGNILNPKKTLKQKDLKANGIKSPEAIVKKMRNPGPLPSHPQEWSGMKMFDKNKISDEDAMKIGEYILKTFH